MKATGITNQLQKRFKKIQIWIGLSLVSAIVVILFYLQILPVLAQHSPEQLNQQGIEQLSQGKDVQALESFQRAERLYQQTQDLTGTLGSQLNQARVLQSMGDYRRARKLLTQMTRSLPVQPITLLHLKSWQELGHLLQLMGDLELAQNALQQSLTIAERLPASPMLDLERSRSLLQWAETKRLMNQLDLALPLYEQAIAIAPAEAKLSAQTLALSAFIQAHRWQATQQLWQQLQPLLDAQSNAQSSAQPSIVNPASRKLTTLYAQIHLAQNWMKQIELAQSSDPALDRSSQQSLQQSLTALPSIQQMAQLLSHAIAQAQALHNRRAESYAMGTLGRLYEQTQQFSHAQSVTQTALLLAQQVNAIDIAYQWKWQQGRLFSKLHQSNAAITAYQSSVEMLQVLRQDLVGINPEVQFSFRESVEPVYRQYVELLLQTDSGKSPSQPNLKRARDVMESLQLAELDNFFREACLTAHPIQIDQIDRRSAIFYPIILPNRLAVIASLPDQPLRYYETRLPQAEVETILDQMQQSLRETAFAQERLPVAHKIYRLLLAPIATELSEQDIKTLVFVLDGTLRNLPIAALHDGKQYVIETYSIAIAPGLQLLQAQPLQRQKLYGLIGGLSQPHQGFGSLPNVTDEIQKIQAEIPTRLLINQQFTNQAIHTQLNHETFPIVHFATHGQFSSRLDETFILTWGDRMTVQDLDQLLTTQMQRTTPIELLVLSACETATGDERAALGMAGVAVRSGARSTLASLWSVSDRSTAQLMTEFYRQLGQSGVSKAEALRLAQLSILKQSNYENPYYWAPFILLGNWL
jgi:CHAT domain-containing protein